MPLAWWDELETQVSRHAGVIQGDDILQAMSWLASELSEPNTGFVSSIPTVPLTGTEVLKVNAALLNLLNYPDPAAYQAALSGGSFVHADDLDIVTAHVTWKSSAVYDARLLKGDGSGYKKCRIQGFSFLVPNAGNPSTVIRYSVIRDAP